MERAALKVAEELERMLADKKQEERILCVCGSGNNGGDGVAVARILKLHGYRTSLYLVGNPDHRTVEMQRQLDIAAACQVPVVNNLETEEYTTIVAVSYTHLFFIKSRFCYLHVLFSLTLCAIMFSKSITFCSVNYNERSHSWNNI